jgi:hypothetical protein
MPAPLPFLPPEKSGRIRGVAPDECPESSPSPSVGFQHPNKIMAIVHVRSQVAGKIEQMRMEYNQHIPEISLIS